jgi:eukaryotic-like serine/threonine-protein kinase
MPIISTERYDIDPQPLGRGGFGEAYAARDLLFDRDVVIKTILVSRLYGIDEPAFRHQFFREAVVSAKLGHKTPYIVKVLDYGYDRESDLPFFVMERIKGGDLASRVGHLTVIEALTVFWHILCGLDIAHKNGVIHSDISPDNILFDAEEGIYKLNDFGLAKLLTSALMSRGASISLTGGKPGYLPIDHWHTGDRNAFTDLYGLAVTIVVLVSGKVPQWGIDFRTNKITGPDIGSFFPATDNDLLLSKLYDSATSVRTF